MPDYLWRVTKHYWSSPEGRNTPDRSDWPGPTRSERPVTGRPPEGSEAWSGQSPADCRRDRRVRGYEGKEKFNGVRSKISDLNIASHLLTWWLRNLIISIISTPHMWTPKQWISVDETDDKSAQDHSQLGKSQKKICCKMSNAAVAILTSSILRRSSDTRAVPFK